MSKFDLEIYIKQLEHAVSYWNAPGISISGAWDWARPILEATARLSKTDIAHFCDYWYIPRNSCPICERVDAWLATLSDGNKNEVSETDED